tara:strand:+ start:2069 stop:2440 length:372 start_codon:yes stop_codon:yes gene_type:complete
MKDDDGLKELERSFTIAGWSILLIITVYITVHFIIAFPKIAHGWDGIDLSADTDISIETGTRSTIPDTIILEPMQEIEVHDWETNESKSVTIIKIDPPTEGPIQMEVQDYGTGDYMDFSLDIN